MSEQSIGKQAVSSFRWQTATTAVLAGARLVVSIVLARLLLPHDFGVFTFSMVVTEFVAIFAEVGIGPALVQRPDLSERHLRVGFTLSMVLGAVAAASLWVVAPWLTSGATLTVLRGLCVPLFFTSLGTVSFNLLLRDLDFRKVFVVELGSYLPGYAVVSIALAARGYGPWSLVGGMLCHTFLRLVLLTRAAPHSHDPLLASVEARELLGFGVGVTLTRLASYVARNADLMVVGRWLGPTPLGLYLCANTFGNMTTGFLTTAVGTVLFPLYSRVRHDRARTKRWYLLASSFIALALLPAMVLLSVSAPEVLGGVFGPPWKGATVPMQLFALTGFLRGLSALSDALVPAQGRVYQQCARHLAFAALVIGGSVLGVHQGIRGVAVGVTLAVVIMFVVMTRLSLKLIGASWREFVAGLRSGAAIGAAVALTSSATVMLLRGKDVPDLGILTLAVPIALMTAWWTLRHLPETWYGEGPGALRDYLGARVPARILGFLLGPSWR